MASDKVITDGVTLDVTLINQLAEAYILEAEKHPRDNRKIRASTIGGCPVRIARSVLGHPEQPKFAHSEYTFWAGHTFGDAATEWMIRMDFLDASPSLVGDEDAILIEDVLDRDGNPTGKKKVTVRGGKGDWKGDTEEEVEDERFKGHYDFLTKPLKQVTDEIKGRSFKRWVSTSDDDPEGLRYLGDFKTMSDRVGFFWQDRNATTRPPMKTPKVRADGTVGNDYYPIAGCLYPGDFSSLRGIPEGYWQQLHIYARILKQKKNLDRIGLMLIVMSKDAEKKIAYRQPEHLMNFPVKVFTRPSLCEETLRKIDEKADYIYSYTNKGELPPIPEEMEAAIAAKGERAFPCGWCAYNNLCRPDVFPKQIGLRDIKPHLYEGLETTLS